MKIEKTLDAIHEKITTIRLLQIFTAFTRLLLFVGFTPPSIIKILNKPFTVLPDSNPVGHYFNALYQTGFYYQFIGWAQLTAAVLLLFPRTAHLGALMFLPIIANIAVLTTSVGFQGTWVVTILMTLAATYLVAWDYDRLKPILFNRRRTNAGFLKFEYLWLPFLFAIGGAAASVFAWSIRLGNASDYFRIGILMTFAGLIFGALVTLHHRFMKIGELENPPEIRVES
ncbi:MAG: DoxX family protein [Acidobacteria bacterium]|nr:DoxX family protein [Acidobacteriota bacterium]